MNPQYINQISLLKGGGALDIETSAGIFFRLLNYGGGATKQIVYSPGVCEGSADCFGSGPWFFFCVRDTRTLEKPL
jgi:hypothetical protein